MAELCQGLNVLEHTWRQGVPEDTAAWFAGVLDGEDTGVGDDVVADGVKHLWLEFDALKELDVVDDGDAVGGGGVDAANGGEHGPLEVEVAVALAEADASVVDGAGAGEHEGHEDVHVLEICETHVCAGPLHAVEGGGVAVERGVDLGRVEEEEATLDAVGGGEKGDVSGEELVAEGLEAVVGGDKEQAPGGGSAAGAADCVPEEVAGQDQRRGRVRALKVGDELGKVPVEAGVRVRHGSQLLPHLFPHVALELLELLCRKAAHRTVLSGGRGPGACEDPSNAQLLCRGAKGGSQGREPGGFIPFCSTELANLPVP